MFHKAIDVKWLDGTAMTVTFQDGTVKQYDVGVLFAKYPQLRALEDRALFTSGKLMGGYGIVWNDDLDLETETVYEDGIFLGREELDYQWESSHAVASARAQTGLSQKQLAELSGIDQSDISKIERGIANPSVSTLRRIAAALGGRLTITIELS